MPGPTSPSEIEDVVSSMRRLMALEPRPRPVSRDLGQDRLVLTPALRIVPDGAKEPPLILTPDASLTPTAVAPVVEPSAGVKVPTPDPLDASTQDLDIREAFEAEWEDEIWAAPEPPLAELALEVEEAELMPDLPPADPLVMVSVETVESMDVEAPWVEAGDDWLDEQEAPFDPVVAFVAAGRGKAASDAAAPLATPSQIVNDQAPDADPAGPTAVEFGAMAATTEVAAAEVTVALAEAVAEAGMDEVGADAASEDAGAEAAAEEAVVAETLAESTASGPAQAEPRLGVLELSAADLLTDGEGNPLTVLDEAALQLIIRQLIREELKGVLGEKITQSVRKLVRAEINRALAAHSLD
jgi:hypothetical protein